MTGQGWLRMVKDGQWWQKNPNKWPRMAERWVKKRTASWPGEVVWLNGHPPMIHHLAFFFAKKFNVL